MLCDESGVVDCFLDFAHERLLEGGTNVLVCITRASRSKEIIVGTGQRQGGQWFLEIRSNGTKRRTVLVMKARWLA